MSNYDLREVFLEAPESQLDPSLKPLIEKWNSPTPSALQVLEVLDLCIFSSLASGFVVNALQAMYQGCLAKDGTTHDELVKLATWRGENPVRFVPKT